MAIKKFDIRGINVSHVVIEIFGGDNNLSNFVKEDLQEMASGNAGNFGVLALTDFANQGAQVIEFSPNNGFTVIEDWGEIDTGDPATLTRFLGRALATYEHIPHIAIGFWDHGSGVFDEFDPNEERLRSASRLPRRLRPFSVPARHLFFSNVSKISNEKLRAMLHDDTNGGVLTNYEAYKVLKNAFNDAGRNQKIDMIFSDTCLNGMIEVLSQMKEFCEVVVGSEDLEPGDGWDYFEWFKMMSNNIPQTANDWAIQAVDAFGKSYKTILESHPCTLAAFATKESDDLVALLEELCKMINEGGRRMYNSLALASMSTQSFADKESYDIKDLCRTLRRNSSSNKLKALCDKISIAFDATQIKSIALGTQVANANGLAIWIPKNRRSFLEVSSTYKNLLFDKQVKWSDLHAKFLT